LKIGALKVRHGHHQSWWPGPGTVGHSPGPTPSRSLRLGPGARTSTGMTPGCSAGPGIMIIKSLARFRRRRAAAAASSSRSGRRARAVMVVPARVPAAVAGGGLSRHAGRNNHDAGAGLLVTRTRSLHGWHILPPVTVRSCWNLNSLSLPA
jgi:hypothetical protein